MPKLIDLTGLRFERLMVIKRIGTKNTFALWLCKCDCGNMVEVRSNGLRSGDFKSCGCLHKEIVANMLKKESGIKNRNFKHGHGSPQKGLSPTYYTWCSMITRCSNSKTRNYRDYGGRGIRVCERWLDKEKGFQNFLEDMGERPKNTTIDRINVNGNYEPSNCRWATWEQQNKNKRIHKPKQDYEGVYRG